MQCVSWFFAKRADSESGECIAPSEAVRKLRDCTDTLEKREAFLRQKIDAESAAAKVYIRGKNKPSALICLARKKAYEAEIEKLGYARLMIEQHVLALEGAALNVETVTAMRIATAGLRPITKEMSVEGVDGVLNAARDVMSDADEINAALVQHATETVDSDATLNDELTAMEAAALDETLAEAEPIGSAAFPAVPVFATAAAKKKKTQEDRELEEFETTIAAVVAE